MPVNSDYYSTEFKHNKIHSTTEWTLTQPNQQTSKKDFIQTEPKHMIQKGRKTQPK